jgi:hypothetical protein
MEHMDDGSVDTLAVAPEAPDRKPRYSDITMTRDADAVVARGAAIVVAACGAFVLGLGVLLTMAWIGGPPALITSAPGPVVTPGDALAILLSGVSLLSLALRRNNLARIAAMALAASAAVQIAQAGGALSLAMDTWLETSVRGLPSGESPSIAAAAIFFFAACTLLAYTFDAIRSRELAAAVTGVFITAIGIFALAGLSAPGSMVPIVALPVASAVAFTLIGLCLQLVGWPTRDVREGWQSTMTSLAGILVTAWFWRMLLQAEGASASPALLALPPGGAVSSLLHIDETVIGAMQVQRMWHVVGVLQGDSDGITLLDTNCRRRQT